MPRTHSTSCTPKSLGPDANPPLADAPATPNPALQRARAFPSTGSLVGADDAPEDARARNADRRISADANKSPALNSSFPANPPEQPHFPAIVSQQQQQQHQQERQHHRRHSSGLPSPSLRPATPPSATSIVDGSNSLQRPPLQPPQPSVQQPQQPQSRHRLSKSSPVSTPSQSTETLHLSRHSPATVPTAAGTAASERRPEIDSNKSGKGGLISSPGTTRSARPRSPAAHNSPAKGSTPPPVNFSFHAASGSGQRTSPCPQAITSPPPQLALQRTASRSRPIIGSAVSLTGTPQGHGALQTSPSPHRALASHPAHHSRASSPDCSLLPSASLFTPLAADDDGAAGVGSAVATSPTEEDQKDLLVERIIHGPHAMGQSSASCAKAHPPRESSNSRSSPEENAAPPAHQQQQRRQDSASRHAQRADTPTGKKGDARAQSRRSRRTPSSSPQDAAGLNRPCLLDSPAPRGAAAAANGEIDDAQWVFQRPPNNQRTFYFKEDNLEFSSQFDSGNLIQVERVGPLQYRMYTAMDCGNSPWQTNNRQWFHFSLRGGTKGAVVTFTFVGMMHSNMFNFDWMPVSAVFPSRPEYARLQGKAKVEASEAMPETPGYPLLVYKAVSRDDADSDGDGNDDDNDGPANGAANSGGAGDRGVAFSIAASNGKGGAPGKKKKSKKKKNISMNLTFEYKIEAEVAVTHTPPKGRPDVASIYLASNHPYTYTRLQRNLVAWQEQARKSNATRSQSVQTAAKAAMLSRAAAGGSADHRGAQTPTSSHLGDASDEQSSSTGGGAGTSSSTTEMPFSGIYFHREVLCRTHESHDVTLLTISDRSRMTMERAPLISAEDGIPYSSAHRTTERPFAFTGKKYVVLTARVHPGECPASHIMHGCIEFLLHRTDPRAVALRHNFVFYVVPMLNPDGVVRGHSRVDSNGVDLNRMYRAPSAKRHPAPYAVMALLRSLGDRVALFVDMHAHANKRGTFFYGNSMDGAEQVENLLYAKLVSLNTPYLDFRSCNFSEANMFAVGKSGKGKDSSSRVVVFTEAGIVHGYTIEASHVMAEGINPIVTLVNSNGEEVEKTLGTPPQLAHTPATLGDTGRAMLVALLDLKSINPLSRLAYTPYHSTRGVAMWLQRQLQIETAEMLFAQAFRTHSKEVMSMHHETGNGLLGPIMRSLTPDEVPDKVTLKKARLLPRTTYSDARNFLSLETAVALLAQTAPTGPPRSLLYISGGVNGNVRRRGGSPATNTNAGAAAAATATSLSPPSAASPNATSPGILELPAVIATKRRPRPNAVGGDTAAES